MESWKTFRKTNRAEWQVSTLGRIKKNGEIYTPYIRGGHKGSRYLCLSINTPHSGYIHRIVASTFIPNPENKRTVNHIDGDKTNNAVSNLEWASYSENNIHAIENKLFAWTLNPESRKVCAVGYSSKNLDQILGYYEKDSIEYRCVQLKQQGYKIREIAEETNQSISNIKNVLYRNYRTYKK